MLMKLVTITTGIQELKDRTDTNSEEQFFAETFSRCWCWGSTEIVITRNKPYKQMKAFWASGLLVRCSRRNVRRKVNLHAVKITSHHCSHWNCLMIQRPVDGIKSLGGCYDSSNKQSLRRRSINNSKNRRRSSKLKLLMSCQGISKSQKMINQQTPYS